MNESDFNFVSRVSTGANESHVPGRLFFIQKNKLVETEMSVTPYQNKFELVEHTEVYAFIAIDKTHWTTCVIRKGDPSKNQGGMWLHTECSLIRGRDNVKELAYQMYLKMNADYEVRLKNKANQIEVDKQKAADVLIRNSKVAIVKATRIQALNDIKQLIIDTEDIELILKDKRVKDLVLIVNTAEAIIRILTDSTF